MTRSKLSASDREELIRLFKETTETITSLANRFQVSISTARRVLKTQLSAEEYEEIVSNRLEGRHSKKMVAQALPEAAIEVDEQAEVVDPATEVDEPAKIAPPIRRPKRRSRRRTSSASEDTGSTVSIEREFEISDTAPPEDEVEPSPVPTGDSTFESASPLEVLPIDTVTLPNQCYLVVDRSAELITPPLKDFSELGTIPIAEESAKTLPIFANHKIASRFSRRSQRIIKVPNSDILKKTYPMLTAKGVERILFEGKVFSLVN